MAQELPILELSWVADMDPLQAKFGYCLAIICLNLSFVGYNFQS